MCRFRRRRGGARQRVSRTAGARWRIAASCGSRGGRADATNNTILASRKAMAAAQTAWHIAQLSLPAGAGICVGDGAAPGVAPAPQSRAASDAGMVRVPSGEQMTSGPNGQPLSEAAIPPGCGPAATHRILKRQCAAIATSASQPPMLSGFLKYAACVMTAQLAVSAPRAQVRRCRSPEGCYLKSGRDIGACGSCGTPRKLSALIPRRCRMPATAPHCLFA